MSHYIAKRIFHGILILLGVTFITYLLLYMLPADPARQIAGRSATAETVANIRIQLGLDLPFYQQYFHYLMDLLQGDMGRSWLQKTEVSTLIASRLPASLLLMCAGIGIELIIGVSLGVIAALKRNSFTDKILMMFSFIGVSSPQFIAAMLFLYLFSVKWALFPIGGYGTWQHLVLPSLTLGILGSGWYSRMVRSSMIDIIHQDFVRTARAKGISQQRIIIKHIIPNAILPIVAMIGIDIGIFMGGLVVVESVFGWPGIGQLVWQAIQRVDIPIIMGVTIISAVAIVLGNLIADLIAPLIDPRIDIRKT